MDLQPDYIFNIQNEQDFDRIAMEIYRFQYSHNDVYRLFCENIARTPNSVSEVMDIPFLPVEFFKSKDVVSIEGPYERAFTSSSTSGQAPSRHLVKKTQIYFDSYVHSFQLNYGNITDYCILALLPSYLEREGSSLTDMVQGLISLSKNQDSGFYLYNHAELSEKIKKQEEKKQKTILLGVSFALLDFAEAFSYPLKHTIIMETGGMKGRRKEVTRQELHQVLCSRFNVSEIHSEYGMTELLSQAYSKGNGLYQAPPWMKVLIRDQYDPFNFIGCEQTGGINVIDLANIYSCSFIETKDLGKLHTNGSFEVIGRFDTSDIRGCNLMVNE